MALPKQVEQQLKEIEQLEKQLQAPEPAPEPPAEPVGQTEEVKEPEPQQQPEAKEVPQPTASPVSEETCEHKYHRLQGKYDAEVPRLHAQVKELQSYVDKLRQDVETKPAQPTETKREKLVTDADVEAFAVSVSCQSCRLWPGSPKMKSRLTESKPT